MSQSQDIEILEIQKRLEFYKQLKIDQDAFDRSLRNPQQADPLDKWIEIYSERLVTLQKAHKEF